MPEEAPIHSVETISGQKPLIRKAQPGDVNEMHRIINHYAEKQLMLPKTELRLYEFLRDYTVAIDAADPKKCLAVARSISTGRTWRKYALLPWIPQCPTEA